MLAEPYGKLPTHRALPLPADPLTRAGALLLRQAAGIGQYFDRDATGELASAGIQVFNAFVRARLSVEAAQAQLEAVRRRLPAAA
jgi:multiple sugar transport system substrate-binding protein